MAQAAPLRVKAESAAVNDSKVDRAKVKVESAVANDSKAEAVKVKVELAVVNDSKAVDKVKVAADKCAAKIQN